MKHSRPECTEVNRGGFSAALGHIFYRNFELGLEVISGFPKCQKCTVNNENAVRMESVSRM